MRRGVGRGGAEGKQQIPLLPDMLFLSRRRRRSIQQQQPTQQQQRRGSSSPTRKLKISPSRARCLQQRRCRVRLRYSLVRLRYSLHSSCPVPRIRTLVTLCATCLLAPVVAAPPHVELYYLYAHTNTHTHTHMRRGLEQARQGMEAWRKHTTCQASSTKSTRQPCRQPGRLRRQQLRGVRGLQQRGLHTQLVPRGRWQALRRWREGQLDQLWPLLTVLPPV